MKYQYLYLFAIAIVVLSFSFIIYQETRVLGTKTLEVTYEIGDKTGFDLNDSVLSFGRLVEGSKSTRQLNLTNTFDKRAKVNFYPSDSINEVIFFNRSGYYLESGESMSISFTLAPKRGTPIGNYTGYLTVKMTK